MKNIIKPLTLIFVLTVISLNAFSQTFNMDLLRGKFIINADDKYSISKSNFGDTTSWEYQNFTTYILKSNNLEFIIGASELYVFKDSNTEKLIYSTKKDNKITKSKVEDIEIYTRKPKKNKEKNGYIIIANYYIIDKDNMMYEITFSLPEKYKKKVKDAFTQSQKIISTIKRTNKKNDLKTGKLKYNILNTKSKIVFDLPKDYFVLNTSERIKNSLNTFVIIKKEPFGRIILTELNITFDENQKLLTIERKLLNYRIPDSKILFMKQSLPIYNFFINVTGEYISENIFDDSQIKKGCDMHIHMHSYKENLINELKDILSKTIIEYY